MTTRWYRICNYFQAGGFNILLKRASIQSKEEWNVKLLLQKLLLRTTPSNYVSWWNKHTPNHLSAQRYCSGRLFDKWLPTVNQLPDSHFWFDHSFQALFSIKWFILRLSSLRYPLFYDTPRGDTHCQTISSCRQYRCFDSRTCTVFRHRRLSENFTSCLANN